MNTQLKTNIDSFKSEAPLYIKYDGQCNPQNAYMELNQDGSVHFNYNAEIGNNIPVSVFNGLIIQIPIDNALTIDGIKQFYYDHKELIQRVINGMGDKWDGSNLVGTLTQDANQAHDELKQTIMQLDWDQYERAEIVDAADLFYTCSITDFDDPSESGIHAECSINAVGVLIITGLQRWIDEQTENL